MRKIEEDNLDRKTNLFSLIEKFVASTHWVSSNDLLIRKAMMIAAARQQIKAAICYMKNKKQKKKSNKFFL